MKTIIAALSLLLLVGNAALAYPPAVGILGKAKSCMSCHVSNGPWTDEQKTIIDILDKDTGKSFKQPDGTFLIQARQGETKTVLTVLGRVKEDESPAPYRNGWVYIDPVEQEKGAASSSKFAPNWEVNLSLGCRLIGDQQQGFEGAKISVAPMSLQPLQNAKDAQIQLQVMLTKGESIKGKPKEGMIGSYFQRKVYLKVIN
ncbi:hypothetical protein A2V82_01720 [candidate division KSB1 bacterium RBG_16_48_16]|nr:MAG: hypothetical protein A2V82_01720 [candidate division KSB1 bacterium RBG_16_48_16]